MNTEDKQNVTWSKENQLCQNNVQGPRYHSTKGKGKGKFDISHSDVSNSYKMYVSFKHNNLLHKIMLTATCFDSNESSSGHPNELLQGMSYIRVHFGIQDAYNES